jgi:type I restriction enzyme S subunit
MILNNNNPSDKRKYPERWTIRSGKRLFISIDERSVDGSEELLTVSHLTGITPRAEKNVTMFKAETLVGYKKVQKRDVASNTMWMWQGAIGVSEYDGVISPSYNVYRQKDDEYTPDYLDLLLREKNMVDVYHSLSTGIRPSRLRLYPEQFFSISFPLPEKEEQKKIVEYINWKVSKINAYAKSLKKQISLLGECKQSILAKVLTKGLDDFETKESGVNFIGRIPNNWRLCQIKYVSSIYNGNSISDSEKDNYTTVTDIPYIATKDVELLSCTANYYNGLYVKNTDGFKLAPTDATLLCIEGGSAGKKKAYLTQKVAFVNKLCAFVPQGINSRFLFYYLCSPAFTGQFNIEMTGLIGGVSINTVKRLIIPIPSEKEQTEIVSYLDRECGRIDLSISHIQKEIEILRELRKKVISDAVTGQIDIRNVVIPEYEHVEEESEENIDEDSDEEDTEEQEE